VCLWPFAILAGREQVASDALHPWTMPSYRSAFPRAFRQPVALRIAESIATRPSLPLTCFLPVQQQLPVDIGDCSRGQRRLCCSIRRRVYLAPCPELRGMRSARSKGPRNATRLHVLVRLFVSPYEYLSSAAHDRRLLLRRCRHGLTGVSTRDGSLHWIPNLHQGSQHRPAWLSCGCAGNTD